MDQDSIDRISRICRSAVQSTQPLTGGCIAEVSLICLANGNQVVAKQAGDDGDLQTEGRMLAYLADQTELPVPRVLHVSQSLLLMQYCHNTSPLSARSQADAAHHLARLHNITAEHFGFDWDTLIGPLAQPNPKSRKWIPFFRDQRLLYMAGLAQQSGRLPDAMLPRLQALAEHLPGLLREPDQPSLIHGDLWTGNVLCHGDRISAFVDPALYFGHAEIELAYSTLFGTFGDAFFDTYQQYRPLQPGFFEGRRDLYNLYPLLVHVRLFGGSYVSQVDTTLRQFGY